MPDAKFALILAAEKFVYIVDLNRGHKSVTNDAEAVTAELFAIYGDKRFFYVDSEGKCDELLHVKSTFTSFSPGPGVPDLTPEQRQRIVDRICDLSAEPCPKIAEASRLRHKATGKMYGIGSIPYGQPEDYERVVVGYCYADTRNGTTYGTVKPTREEKEQEHTAREAQKRETTAAAMRERGVGALIESLRYWEGEQVPRYFAPAAPKKRRHK